MRTQVAIIGAGPAGLLLGQLLHRAGVDNVILENRSQDYVLARVRAGVLESGTVALLKRAGVGERCKAEGLVHDGFDLAFGGARHRIDLKRLTGRSVTVYGQTEITKDLIQARAEAGAETIYEARDVTLDGFDTEKPRIVFNGKEQVDCDFIAGCDGFHGICRPSIPDGVLSTFERDYPFGWLGILSESPPPDHELIYSYTDRGFALYTMRSANLARLYLQCDHDEEIENWPDARIWDELHKRIGGARKLAEGAMLQKGVTPMRSFVVEPMQYGRLYLAGDSAHIVPPTGAKGMNLAFADVVFLSRALEAFYSKRQEELLQGYSAQCLRRVWKAQRFSWWMTQIMHRFPHESAFDRRRQLADLDYLTSSESAARSLAEQYVGLPLA